jgi:hypothetical protein
MQFLCSHFVLCTLHVLWHAHLSPTTNMVTPLKTIKTLMMVFAWTSWRFIAQRGWCDCQCQGYLCLFLCYAIVLRKVLCLPSFWIRSVNTCAGMITAKDRKCYVLIIWSFVSVRTGIGYGVSQVGFREKSWSKYIQFWNTSKNCRFPSKDRKKCFSVSYSVSWVI